MQTNIFANDRMRLLGLLFCCMFLMHGCDRADPKPVNEEEVITTVAVTLEADGADPVTLKFYDADGEYGDIEPVISISGPLKASTRYAASIELLNETLSPSERISGEISEEATDHLFCFEATENIVIAYADTDDNGDPVGLMTTWTTATAGEALVEILLRHQAGTKTGECPGTGETDVQVTFQLMIE